MYNKLYTKILDSSIWLEEMHIRIVWITMLAMMDQDGMVPLSCVSNVALRSRVSMEQAEEAVRCLEREDSRNPDQDNGGRRIERVPGVGWMVLNGPRYRNMKTTQSQRDARFEQGERP